MLSPWPVVEMFYFGGTKSAIFRVSVKAFFKGVIYFYAPFLYAKLTVSHIIAESVSKVLSRADPWS